METEAPSIEQDLELLSADLAEPEVEEVVEETEESEETSEDKVEEKVDETEEEAPESTKDLPPHERPTIAQLKTAYPDIFKKFPSLRDVYFREREFSEIYNSVSEAREASENSSQLAELRGEVLSGSADKLFNTINTADKAALGKLAGNVLDSLYKISPDLHWKATVPLLENVVKSFYSEGQRKQDETYINSALWLAEYLFNDPQVATGQKTLLPPKTDSKLDDERKRLEDDRKKYDESKDLDFRIGVVESYSSELKKLVLERGQGNRPKLDPDGNFSQFIKDSIQEKTIAEVDRQMTEDKAHIKYMNSLWQRAKTEGYRGDWKAKIISASLARAKPLVASVRAKYVSEALGTSSAINNQKGEKLQKAASRKELSSKSVPDNKPIDPRKVDWNKTSDMDILNGTVSYK